MQHIPEWLASITALAAIVFGFAMLRFTRSRLNGLGFCATALVVVGITMLLLRHALVLMNATMADSRVIAAAALFGSISIIVWSILLFGSRIFLRPRHRSH